MFNKLSIAAFICSISILNASGTPLTCCGKLSVPSRFTLSHIEAKGVGYEHGYTSIDGFFAPFDPLNGRWIPFLDLRAHVFNTGKPAANAGIGLRYFNSWIWGINAYYDYRRTKETHYNQISLGLETLGRIWDFRINGYLPVGAKNSDLFDLQFAGFQGNNLFVSFKKEFAFKSANAEVGAHITEMDWGALYAAAGPYYLNGKKSAFGGDARVALDISEYVRLEANTSYDNIFKWIGQGQISFNFPLGKREVRHQDKSCCPSYMAMKKRSFQRVDRNEIIPVDDKKTTTNAIDPRTGAPLFFIFVNNTSSSLGTFESPFPTLVQAENASNPFDIIYVFLGDGTSMGMDAGNYVLKNDLKLFGAGIDHTVNTTLGSITIPPHATGMPMITSTSPDPILVCSNNNEISGIFLDVDPIVRGIECANITNVFIHRNHIDVDGDNVLLSPGVYFENCSGTLTVIQNEFTTGIDFPWCIWLRSTALSSNYNFSGNNFSARLLGENAGAIELAESGTPIGSFDSLRIENNRITDMEQKAIGGFGFNGTGKITLANNVFTRVGDTASAMTQVRLRVRDSGNINFQIYNNTWQESLVPASSAIRIDLPSPTASCCVTLEGNSSDSSPAAYVLDNSSGGSFTAEVGDNIGAVSEIGTITPGTCP